uniref:Cytochrome c oxidase subunit 2 n=1 Tax=Pleurostomum flabellatum TaxID=405751 RepID=A0A7T0Q4U4_9EUKA|nr:cytochrome c oxidase subunit 2 [Pleurostomum flabellatum]QPL15607.1 cytochrome c oxidase subunit 2 [Pleurostomum flabellatum]
MLHLTNYLGFGIPGNEKMLSIIFLYAEMMSILIGVVFAIAYIVVYTSKNFQGMKNKIPFYFSFNIEGFLDTVFAIIPTVIITIILLPALGFIFQLEYDETFLETLFNVYVIGHQWYWTYEIDTRMGSQVLIDFYDSDFRFPSIQFDSYMSQDVDVNRVLSVDKSLVLPTGYHISFYITSHDVIHSWSVPQLGVKVDAIPGRLVKFILYASIKGIYYGQCSELCGINHAFMPICVEVVESSSFVDWVILSSDCNVVQHVDDLFLMSLIA